jgi:hypothetical protein
VRRPKSEMDKCSTLCPTTWALVIAESLVGGRSRMAASLPLRAILISTGDPPAVLSDRSSCYSRDRYGKCSKAVVLRL